MEIHLKNDRTDPIFFDLRDVTDKPPIKITDLLTPGDVIDRPSTGGTMRLSITAQEKSIFSSGSEWSGFVPANTTDPINVGLAPDGSISVSFDETIVPNINPSIWDSKIPVYISAAVLIALMIFLGYYIYSNRKKR